MLRRIIPPWVSFAGLLVMAISLGSAAAFGASSIAWSPDGKWVCYVDQSPPAAARLPVDWVFESSAESDTPAPAVKPAAAAPAAPRRSRLWATEVNTRQSVLIEDADGLIACPCWGPDGHSLSFVRLTPGASGRGKFEVVIRDALNRRVLVTKTIEDWADEVSHVGKMAISWTPDGRFVAVPVVNPIGLAIFRIETGRLIKTIDGAILPAWSPDGGKLLYVSTGDEDWLECLESHFGASRHLADVGHLESPPIFARDGQSVVALARARTERGAAPPSESVELWRIRLDDRKKERLTTIATTTGEQVLHSASITADKDGETVYYSTSISSEPSQLSLYPLRERSVLDKFPVLDQSFAIDNLSLSPKSNLNVRPPEGLLALRLNGLPLLCDLGSRQLVPLVPDNDLRSAWGAALLTSVERLIRDLRPSPVMAGRAIERPLALPMPGELEANSEALQRFRRFGRIGHELNKTPQKDGGWPVADLIFDYLREDFPAALRSLESLEAREEQPDLRLRMLNLRAQIFVGLGDFERARGTLGYLKTTETERSRRLIEQMSQGAMISKIAVPEAGWSDYALGRIATLEKEAAKEEAKEDGPIAPTDHRNFDAPAPGLGLDFPVDPPIKNIGPLPVRPNFPNPPLPENGPFLRRPVMPDRK